MINEDIKINLFEENEFITTGRIDSSYNYDKSSETTLDEENENLEIKNFKNLKLIKFISNYLLELIEENIKNKRVKFINDSFNGKNIYDIPIYDYINRIISLSEIEENTIICSLIYMNKINEIKPISKFNVHKLFFSSVLTSIKYNEDFIFSNIDYAKFGYLTLKEINKMEFDFISLLEFNLYIKSEVFDLYKQNF